MKNTVLLTILLVASLASITANARHKHRHGHGGSGALANALGGTRPAGSIEKGQCDIEIDCPHYKISVDGEEAGQIICGNQTGRNFSKTKVTLNTSVIGASGKILPRGFPMMSTSPSLCPNCFIHVYPWVGPKSHSLGCVGVTSKAWAKLQKCGGSQISFTAMNGARSAAPETMLAKNKDNKDVAKAAPDKTVAAGAGVDR